ncbi:hypothetical protein CDAR_125291 [Caerostris darwini]|uniref:Uncharacterized protein n=1 Tax=Caerostris darwini TaxID=1538125 RepID=A0AAV4Q6K7_9ARAC|nr:hypothetical protein CDAR_125291 [Caerostris darwini]
MEEGNFEPMPPLKARQPKDDNEVEQFPALSPRLNEVSIPIDLDFRLMARGFNGGDHIHSHSPDAPCKMSRGILAWMRPTCDSQTEECNPQL